ncbi:MAG: sugar ABC transporter ATP-binding protein [Velocimicrobium sp.]
MNILQMKNIYKSFNAVEVLHDVNFEVKKGECIAICGENGAGKSTLMKILAGIHSYQGKIIFKDKEIEHNSPIEAQKLGIAMIHQELNLQDEMTVAQNIFLCREPIKHGRINFKKMELDAKEVLCELEPIDPSKKIKNLGIAKKQIVEIAKAISYNSDLIIMDEPTAVLTIKETKMLFELIRKLKQRGVAIVYISHRLKEIMEICDRVTILRDGNFIKTKKIEETSENEIAELMVGRKVEKVENNPYKGSGEKVLEVEHLTDKFLKNVSFSLRKGEILGMFGLVGAGRTEVAETIFGIRKKESGTFKINGVDVNIHCPINAIHAKIAFATEDRKGNGLLLERSINENSNVVARLITKGHRIDKKKDKLITDDIIKKFSVKCNGTSQKIKNLSGGNQQKIVLGKWMAVNPDILILDEPTRGVDIGARKEIYDVINELAANGISILIISSDLTEVLSVSQRVIIMHEGVITGELDSSEMNEGTVMLYATNIKKA